jgi:hypothetical protein
MVESESATESSSTGGIYRREHQVVKFYQYKIELLKPWSYNITKISESSMV